LANTAGPRSQRRVGLAMNVLFSLMKLCEYERLYSGLPPIEPHPLHRNPPH
jgi:hypothetical protein